MGSSMKSALIHALSWPGLKCRRQCVKNFGAIAHLGERLFCKQEVVGSSPTGSTKQYLAGVTVAQ